MVAPGEPLRETVRPFRPLADGEVRVRVAGCGVCHTDLGFLYGGVRTRHPLPLILGHEISGIVEEGGARFRGLEGAAVIVPAVIPCGECRWCRAGRPTICPHQVMPGNDVDGGFASHVVVSGHALCLVPGVTDPDAPIGTKGLTLRELSVIADAITTPYQAVQRSGLEHGDLAIVVGLGGIGGYAAQLAALRGAVVVGLDTDPLKVAAAAGLSAAFDPSGLDSRAVRARIQELARAEGAPERAWKIFECSGSPIGQRLAFDLLTYGATLLVVGHTPRTIEVRLSNLMAFDAQAIGTWGCAPEHYPAVLDLVCAGRVDVAGRVDLRPLVGINETLAELHEHAGLARVVLAPEPPQEIACT
jgi:6-hydroxycyclohex-1-ene-1-carbonyl-CoA dehydrogenase